MTDKISQKTKEELIYLGFNPVPTSVAMIGGKRHIGFDRVDFKWQKRAQFIFKISGKRK
jgi:hypothetical protein